MTTRGLPKTGAIFRQFGVVGRSGEKTINRFDPAGTGISNLLAPEKLKIPPTPAPAPTPTSLDEDTIQKERARRRQRINAAGRGGTILTGGSTLSSSSTASTSLLGG